MMIRSKLRATLVVLFALIVGIVGLNFAAFEQLQGDSQAVNASGSLRMRAYRLAWLSSRLVQADEATAADLRGEIRAYIDDYERVLQGLESGDAEMRLPPAEDAEVCRQLAEVKPLWSAYRDDVLAVAAAATPAERAAAEAKVDRGVSPYAERVDLLVNAYDNASQAKIAAATKFGIVAVVIALIVFGGSSYIIISQMLRPLAALTLSFVRVAGREGDLRQKLHADRADEIGRIVHYFNTFVADLRAIVRAAQECSAEVAALADNLWKASVENSSAVEYAAAAVTNMAEHTQRQNADIRTLSTSVAGIAAQVTQMQGHMDDAAQTPALRASTELTRACADSASAAAESVAAAAQEIADLTEENAAAVEEQSASLQAFAAAAEQLSGLAKKLDGLVGKFKV
ncbi:type IV pili methyl-accepting chemotaxis transducer N-terminal domain-containing protein [Selenomonas sp. F0473]|uniref:type IV pili methyl-accepting chemotaxis transducer N-terminal domain-containing protein n=1 Tax=Selenomonas sp. F0473 TaxID=999423 RepID=UPI00029E5C9F|nr:type IV pili methyl-accepting chemotaxis transducer N-terminal domain-containing protein [Selenomonas sp. F0473]EKU70947.1 hypothetical protein HMPREF9161_01496 [Selenomonas sp. F0473]